MKSLLRLLALLVWTSFATAEPLPQIQQQFEQEWEKSLAQVLQLYPESANPESPLSKKAAEIQDAYAASKDPSLQAIYYSASSPLHFFQQAAAALHLKSTAAAAQKNAPASEFSRYEQEFYLREAGQMYPQAATASSALSQKARKIYAAWKAAHDPRAATASGMLDCYIAAAESLNIQPSGKHEQITEARKAAEIQAEKLALQQHEERMAFNRIIQKEEELRREQDRQAGAAAQQYIAQQNQYAARAAAQQQASTAYAAAQPSVSPYSNVSNYQRYLDAQAGIYHPSAAPAAPIPSAPLDPNFNLMSSPIELRGIPGSPWQHDINSSTTYRVTPIPGGGVRLER